MGKISIIGSGVVGTTIGKGFKELGNDVIFYDISKGSNHGSWFGNKASTRDKRACQGDATPFSRNSKGGICVKPLLQVVFEQLYEFGIKEICFIVGRGKRAIEDHYTPDDNLLELLEKSNKK